jgi:xylulokinase
MNLLGLDVGSSSVRAAILKNGGIRGPIVRAPFPTHFADRRAEVRCEDVLKALASAMAQIGPAAKQADAIALTNMAPSWVAMDKTGKAITPIITHQDRRSVDIARDLESRVGKDRLLQLSGNRPFPGGISSTTLAWHLQNEPALMKKADLIGHLNTWLHRQLTGARITDPSNASFMGLYSTVTLDGWNAEVIDAVGVSPRLLPEVIESDRIGGTITRAAGGRFGLTPGAPMIAGCMDGSAAMLAAGARPGQLMDICGSTGVLALCTNRPKPHERLLTRALGIGQLWMSVSTLAAAGSALMWVRNQFFAEWPPRKFWKLTANLAANPLPGTVRFEPYLAGDRMSIEQRQGALSGLTLSTTRQEILSAVIESLAQASAARLPILRQGGVRIRRTVMASGGMDGALERVLHRDWTGRWVFRPEKEATLRGLGKIVPRK